MTLDELLALLPDNTTGEISAADLRAIVTELFNRAVTVDDRYAIRWTTDATPAVGRIRIAGGWAVGVTTADIAEETDDGILLTFGAIDSPAFVVWFSLVSASGSWVGVKCTGPSVDHGTYRTVPVEVIGAGGSAPATGELLDLRVIVQPAGA